MKNRLLVWLSAFVIRTVAKSLRVTTEDRGGVLDHPDHPPVIMAFWHNRTFLMAAFWERFCSGRTALTFISRSRDGQFISDVATRFGITPVRGSSSRHGMAAALTAIRAAGDPRVDIVITPDGPRGPRYQLQPGLLRLAQTTQRPIVALTYRLDRKWSLNSWDRFHIPIPFSKCCMVTSPLIVVPEDATEAELEAIGRQVSEALGGD